MHLVTGRPPYGGPDGEEDERRGASVEQQQRGRHPLRSGVGKGDAPVVEREHAMEGLEEGDELRRRSSVEGASSGC